MGATNGGPVRAMGQRPRHPSRSTSILHQGIQDWAGQIVRILKKPLDAAWPFPSAELGRGSGWVAGARGGERSGRTRTSVLGRAILSLAAWDAASRASARSSLRLRLRRKPLSQHDPRLLCVQVRNRTAGMVWSGKSE